MGRFDSAIAALRRFHQYPVRLANTELSVGHSASCVRRRRTGRHANVHRNRQPRSGLSHRRNSARRNRIARNLFRMDATEDPLARGPGEGVV